MAALARLIRFLSRAFGVMAAAMIVIAVAIVCHMVFVRYVLGGSTVWQTPLVTYLLIAATFLGSPYVLLVRGHVNVDLLPIYVRPRARMALAVIANLMSLAFCLVLLWYGIGFWHEAWAGAWMSSSIWRIPLWIPYLSMPVGFGLMVLQYLVDIHDLVSGREPPFGMRESAP